MHRQLSKAAGWIALGSGISQALLLLAISYCANRLPAEEFGRLGFLYQTYLTLNTIVASGIGEAIVRTFAERLGNARLCARDLWDYLGIVSVLLIVPAVLILIGSGYLAKWWFQSNRFQPEIVASAFSFFFGGLIVIPLSILSGLKQYREVSLLNIGRGFLLSLGMIAGLLVGSTREVMMGLAIGSLLALLLAVVFVAKVSSSASQCPKEHQRPSKIRETLLFGLPLTISSIVGSGSMWLGLHAILLQPDGIVQMAFITLALQWRNLILFLPTMVNKAGLPYLVESWSRRDVESFLKQLALTMRWITFITVLPIPVLLFIQMGFYKHLSGWNAILATLLILISAPVSAISANISNAVIALGRAWQGFYLNCAWAFLFLLSLQLPLPSGVRFGLALVLSYLILGGLVLVHVRTHLRHATGDRVH